MSCEKLKNWLDEGNFASSIQDMPQEMRSHAQTCSYCQQIIKTTANALSKLKKSSTLSPQKQQQIFKELHNRIASGSALAKKMPSFSEKLQAFFAEKIFARYALAGFAVLILVVSVSLVWHKSSGKTSSINEVYALGSGELQRRGKLIKLGAAKVSIQADDVVIVDKEAMVISWNKAEKIELKGKSSHRIAKNGLNMISGQVLMSFKPSARGYRIEMNNSTLKVVGTVLKLEILKDCDSIEVESGKIEWKIKNSKDSGTLEKGQSLMIFKDKAVTPGKPHEHIKPKSANKNPDIDTIQEPDLPWQEE